MALLKMLTKHTWSRPIFLVSAILFFGYSTNGIVTIAGNAHAQSQPGIASLQSEIDTILADPRLKGAQVDVLVRSAENGSVLYSHDESNLLIPASNNKLYSSGAALEVLGKDYRFATTVATDGKKWVLSSLEIFT